MVQWGANEGAVMNECYMWMRAHVSDRGILYLFTVRFLLYGKHLFLPNRLLQGMFSIIPQNSSWFNNLRIIITLVATFTGLWFHSNKWRSLFVLLLFLVWDSVSVASVLTVRSKNIYILFFSQVLPFRICSSSPCIILWTKNNHLRQQYSTNASYIGHLEACFYPTNLNNHYLNVLVHDEATTEENHS